MHFLELTFAFLAAKIMYPFVMVAIAMVFVVIKGIFDDVVEKLNKKKGSRNIKN